MSLFRGLGRALGGIARVAGPVASAVTGNPAWSMAGNVAGSLFGGREAAGLSYNNASNPANAAEGYLSQIGPMAEANLRPYINQGRTSDEAARNYLGSSRDIYQQGPNSPLSPFGDMARDPIAFANRIMQSYRPSEGYRFKEGRTLGAARNSAASGGFAGTRFDQENQAGLTRDLLSQDMNDYFSQILGVQGAGLGGEERRLQGLGNSYNNLAKFEGDLGTRGYNAAEALTNAQGGLGIARGTNAMYGQGYANQGRDAVRSNRNDLFASIPGMLRTMGLGQESDPFEGQPRVWQNPNDAQAQSRTTAAPRYNMNRGNGGLGGGVRDAFSNFQLPFNPP